MTTSDRILSAAIVFIGLAVANLICAPTADKAIERCFFQAVAIIALSITQHIGGK